MTDPSHRGRNARRKGASFERIIAARFRDAGVTASRTLQSRGGGKEGADVAVAGMHIECKAGASPSLWTAYDQAARDAPAGVPPIVIAHRDQRVVGEGATEVVVMPLDVAWPFLVEMAQGRR